MTTLLNVAIFFVRFYKVPSRKHSDDVSRRPRILAVLNNPLLLSHYENAAAGVVGNSVRKLCNSLNMVGFWDVTPYSLVDIFWYFRTRPNLKSG